MIVTVIVTGFTDVRVSRSRDRTSVATPVWSWRRQHRPPRRTSPTSRSSTALRVRAPTSRQWVHRSSRQSQWPLPCHGLQAGSVQRHRRSDAQFPGPGVDQAGGNRVLDGQADRLEERLICRPSRAIRRFKLSTRSFCCSLTDAILPSRDTYTALNMRAGIPYRCRYSLFNATPDPPPPRQTTSAPRQRTWQRTSGRCQDAASAYLRCRQCLLFH